MTETAFENNETTESLNNKRLETMNDRVIIASYFLSPFSNITNPEHTSHFKLVKRSSSIKINDLLLNKTITVTLYNDSLTFCDTDENFELQGDLLKLMTNKYYNVDLVTSQDTRTMYDFAKEMYFDQEAPGKKSLRVRSLITILKSLGVVVSASSVSRSHNNKILSKTRFLSSDPNELCDRIKLLLQEKQTGKNLT